MWSGEEFWGRYLDLNVHHESWINLPGNKVADAEPISYADYADAFGKLDDIPIGKKTAWGSKYHAYVKLLRMYLDSFATRAQPLLKHTDPWTPSKSEFDAAWAAGTVQGWGKPSAAADAEDRCVCCESPPARAVGGGGAAAAALMECGRELRSD